MRKVVILLVAAVILLAVPAFAMDRLDDSFEYDAWSNPGGGTGTYMSENGWTSASTANTVSDANVQFLTSASTPPITPVTGNKAMCFRGLAQPVAAKNLPQDYGNAVFKCSWYYNPSEGRDPQNGYFTLKSLSGTYVMVRANTVDAVTNRRSIAIRWNSTAVTNIGVFQIGWNDFKVVYQPNEGSTLTTVSVYINGVLAAQKADFNAAGGLGNIALGRTWANNPGYDTVFDSIRISSDGHYITPHIKTVTTGATQEFNFATTTESLPVTWEVVGGGGTIVPSTDPGKPTVGVFTAGLTPGPCKIRVTDNVGHTDYVVVNIAAPVIDPSPASIVMGTPATFTYVNAMAPVTWAVQNESGGTGSVGTINSATGVFTPIEPGTCQVTAADSAGNTSVAPVTVIGQGSHLYTPDNNTLALYHLDEGSGQTWYDSSFNNLTATTLSANLPLYHTGGLFGNAATGFRAAGADYTCIQTPGTATLSGEELTAEAWIYYPTGTDPQGNGTNCHTIACRRGPNAWGLALGKYGVGAAGTLTFLWWGPTQQGLASANLNLSTNTWYHVAATFKKVSYTPTYEVKLYCTPQGATTPVEVATATTTFPLGQGNGYLRIGGETTNARSFPGYIDEVRISNRARTPEELSVTMGTHPEIVASPVITPGSGAYMFPLEAVTITCPTPGTTIYYTTDGLDPTLSSPVYDGTPIQVGESMTVKAMAVKEGFMPGYATAKYTVGLTGLNRPQVIPYSDAVTLNGDLSDWADAEWAPLDKVYDNLPTSDIEEAYYSAKWGENGNKLYVAVKVRDTTPICTPVYDAWNTRDAVELYIHTTGTGPMPYNAGTQPYESAQQYAAGFTSPMSSDLWSAIGDGLDHRVDPPIPVTIPAGAFTVAGTLTPVLIDEVNQIYHYWMVYEAAITPYHHFSLDGTGLVVSTLSAGQVIGFDAVAGSHNGTSFGMKAENQLGQKFNNYNQMVPHLLIGSGTNINIAQAKTAAFGTQAYVSGIVSAVFTDYFYIESADRTYGIRVNKPGHGRSVGESVIVRGTISTLNSTERYVYGLSITVTGSGEIKPLAMNNLTLGGGNYGTLPNGQAGVASGSGVNNIGLLVQVTGKVTSKGTTNGTNWFAIDDGSAVGVKVYGTVPPATPYVTVKGICSCEKDTAGAVQRVILAKEILENVP